MPFLVSGKVLQEEKNAFTVAVETKPAEGSSVKVSFFGAITFGRVGEPEITNDGVLAVASPLDLQGTKLKVLLQRAEAKDYRDIAALLRLGVRLAEGLGAATALYGRTFQPQEALRALTYFEGGDLDRLGSADWDLLVRAAATVGEVGEIGVLSGVLGVPGYGQSSPHSESGPLGAGPGLD
jgi:uncharacterized protein YdbL (DUF1318 family)